MKKSKKQIRKKYLETSKAYQEFYKEHNLVNSTDGFREFCKEAI